jgi:hypothetical protein
VAVSSDWTRRATESTCGSAVTGFAPDGAFRPLAWFDSLHVERLFRAEVLRMLLGKELIGEATVDNLLSWRHSGFSAHGAVRVEDRQGAVRLGRYMIRCPIVLKRLSWEKETGEVVCQGQPSRRGRRDGGYARWDVLEFLARVVDHIPEPSQQMVRYWGFYANAARGKRRKAAQGDNAIEPPTCRDDDDEFTRRARLTWAKLIRRVYEVDPLLCPFCGAEMKIRAFVLDFAAAKAIRRSRKLPAQEPEPLAHAP